MSKSTGVTPGLRSRILNPDAAVEYLDGAVTVGTLAKWRSSGIGPRFLRIGSKIFYEQAALDAYIESREPNDCCLARELQHQDFFVLLPPRLISRAGARAARFGRTGAPRSQERIK